MNKLALWLLRCITGTSEFLQLVGRNLTIPVLGEEEVVSDAYK